MGYLGVRHLQCLFVFLGVTVAYALRVNVNVGILAMTDKAYANQEQSEFDWSERIQSIVLSSFYFGYTMTQIPGGFIAVAYGGKMVLGTSICLSSLMAFLLPTCAEIGGWHLVCAVRMIDGLSQGSIFPSLHAILSSWSPIEERGLLCAFCFSGIQLGTFVSTLFSGFIAASFLGWPFVFYIPGAIGLTWTLCFCILGASSPSECRYISDDEKNKIDTSLAQVAIQGIARKKLKLPLKDILRSIPFWAAAFAQCSNIWGLTTLNTQIPVYFKNILHFNLKSNAVLASIPWLVMLFFCLIFGTVTTTLEKHYNVNPWTCRRLANCVGELTPVVGLTTLAFLGDQNTDLAVALIITLVGCNGACLISYSLTYIDIAPNFAGALMGIGNTLCNIMSFLAPLFVGVFVTDVEDPYQWRIVFFFASGYYFLGNLIYVLFGTAKVQPWNESRQAPPTE